MPTSVKLVKFCLEIVRPILHTVIITMSPIERTIQVSFQQKVYFTRHVFDLSNPLLKDVLLDGQSGDTPKALVVVDESLHIAQPALTRQVEAYFAGFGDGLKLLCPPIILEGGERVKNSY